MVHFGHVKQVHFGSSGVSLMEMMSMRCGSSLILAFVIALKWVVGDVGKMQKRPVLRSNSSRWVSSGDGSVVVGHGAGCIMFTLALSGFGMGGFGRGPGWC